MKKPDRNSQSPVVGGRWSVVGGLRRLVWGVPLGWQLSALYTLLLVVTLSLVGALVYSQQESFLVQDVAQRLEQQATRIAVLPMPERGPGEGEPRPSGQPEPITPPSANEAETHLVGNLVRGLSGPDVTVAILDTQGTVITSTQSLEGGSPLVVEPVTAQQVSDALKSNQPMQWIVRSSDGVRHVVVLMAVTQQSLGSSNSAPITLLVEQSASLAAADAALNRLGTYLLLGVLGGTLVGVILVLVFTRGVLRPLDRVADTADAIASGDLQRRLQLPAGRNEVARLGKAFDYMVGRLVAALETQRRFVADASHELRTPLTSLKGLAEILVIGAHGNDTRVIEESAQAINSELDRLIRLVTDLLTLSRLGSARNGASPTARRTRVDICATIGAVASQMAPLAEARGVTLTHGCVSPLFVLGDAGQVKQVLLNLADNALRYTPKGGAVTLRGKPDGDTARIEVQDTGSGIDPHDLPHIFERFYRGDASRSRAAGNSGLGLAIAHGIVEAHGGAISVRSTPGVGTCFTIMLPLTSSGVNEAAAVHVGEAR
jgi:signal transduction histidine kinase